MTTMSDQEREAHIKDCGRLMQEAMAEGKRNQALGWLEDMNHAIAMRSPEQIARMEKERGLDVCETFDHLAERDMPVFLRRQAA